METSLLPGGEGLNGDSSHHQPPPPPPPPPPPSHTLSSNDLDLEDELPRVTTDLIPLSYLISRLISESYSDLISLFETLPSHSDRQRKQSIIDYVLHTRRQFLKSLVITRWSTESSRISKSINIIGFLSNQNYLLKQSIENLEQVGDGLKNARVRNYDLETSLQVKLLKNYNNLPSTIREVFKGQEKFNDDQVIETMRECESVMRWRLKMGKEGNLQNYNYEIKDGRVNFTVNGLWRASFVYSGDEETGQEGEWYLLSIEFLFNVKTDQSQGQGSQYWNPTPKGPLKQHLIDLCNSQLSSSEQQGGSLEKGFNFLNRLGLSYQLESLYSQAVQLIQKSDWTGCGLKVEYDRQDERVSLKYWCDPTTNSQTTNGGTLIFSTSPISTPTSTSTSSGSSSLKSITNRRRKALDTLLNRSSTFTSTSTTSPPPPPPPTSSSTSIQITYVPSMTTTTTTTTNDFNFDDDEDKLNLEVILNRVTKKHCKQLVRQVLDELKMSNTEDECKIVYPPRQSRKRKSRSTSSGGIESSEEEEGEEEEEEVPYVYIPLVGPHGLILEIDSKSGKINLKSTSTTTATTTREEGEMEEDSNNSNSRESRLRSASDRLNSLRFSSSEGTTTTISWIKSLGEVIAKIRATTVLDEVTTLLNLLSLPSLRRLPLTTRELLKFGNLKGLQLGRPTFLFVPLNSHEINGGLEGFYLSIVAMERGIRMALIGTEERGNNNNNPPPGPGEEANQQQQQQQWVEITQVGWIYSDNNKGKQVFNDEDDEEERGSNFGHLVSAETLRKVYEFCVHRILIFRLEQQLHSRQISYKSSSSTSSSSSSHSPTTKLIIDLEPPPFLILDTQELLLKNSLLPPLHRSSHSSSSSSLMMRTAALKCQIDQESNTIRTTLHVRFNSSSPTTNSLPPPFTTLTDDDKESKLLPRNVFYNPRTKTLVFLTQDKILDTSERLLKAYAGFMKELFESVERNERKEKETVKLRGKGGEGDG